MNEVHKNNANTLIKYILNSKASTSYSKCLDTHTYPDIWNLS